MFRAPSVMMDSRAGTSVMVPTLPDRRMYWTATLPTAAGSPSHSVQLHDERAWSSATVSSGDRQRRKGQSAGPIYTKREPPVMGH
jgi:hypothetical protein